MNSIYTIAIIFQNKQNLLTAEIQRIREERSNSVNSFSKCLKSNTHFHPDMGAYEFEGSSLTGDLNGVGLPPPERGFGIWNYVKFSFICTLVGLLCCGTVGACGIYLRQYPWIVDNNHI